MCKINDYSKVLKRGCTGNCFFCAEGHNCNYFKHLPFEDQNGKPIKTLDGLTIQQVLDELAEKYKIRLANTDTRSMGLIRIWINRGFIDGPITREGQEGAGGRHGIYSKDLPSQLATIYDLKTNQKMSFKEIMGVMKKDRSNLIYGKGGKFYVQ